MANYPTSLDNFTNPTSSDPLNVPSHSLQHADVNDAIEAIEAKLGIGASPAGSATSGYVLTAGTGGTTTWQPLSVGVVQVKSTTKTTAFSTTSATFVDVTDLSVSITPTSASNKILVLATVSGVGANVSEAGATGFVIVRGSTQIGVSTDGTVKFSGHLSRRLVSDSNAFSLNSAANVLDSPATTSATTYKIQVRGSGGGTTYINRDTDFNGSVSSITVLEVAP